MQRLITCSLVVILSLAVAGAARADGHRGHPSGNGRSGDSRHYDGHKDYHLTHGVAFKYGTYYKGKSHSHWSKWYWSERYGCTIYWCPYACAWYYWCQPDECYYPVSYCPTGRYAY